jgi:hypothetical protein
MRSIYIIVYFFFIVNRRDNDWYSALQQLGDQYNMLIRGGGFEVGGKCVCFGISSKLKVYTVPTTSVTNLSEKETTKQRAAKKQLATSSL